MLVSSGRNEEKRNGGNVKTAIFLVGVGLALLATSASASNWTPIGRTQSGLLEYETTTIKYRGSNVIVWYRVTYDQPQSAPIGKYDREVVRVDIDCANDTAVFLAETFLLRGEVILSPGVQTPAGQISPDSLIHNVEQAACKAQ